VEVVEVGLVEVVVVGIAEPIEEAAEVCIEVGTVEAAEVDIEVPVEEVAEVDIEEAFQQNTTALLEADSEMQTNLDTTDYSKEEAVIPPDYHKGNY
jgi:hypothetical protein